MGYVKDFPQAVCLIFGLTMLCVQYSMLVEQLLAYDYECCGAPNQPKQHC